MSNQLKWCHYCSTSLQTRKSKLNEFNNVMSTRHMNTQLHNAWRWMITPVGTLLILLLMQSTDERLEIINWTGTSTLKWRFFTEGIGINARFICPGTPMAPWSDASDFPIVSIQCNQWASRISLELQDTNTKCWWAIGKVWNLPGRCQFLPPWSLRKSSGKWHLLNKMIPHCT